MNKRVTIDLSEAATVELDKLKAKTGLNTAMTFRHAFTLLRIYVECEERGKQMRVIGTEGQVRIVLPFIVEGEKGEGE